MNLQNVLLLYILNILHSYCTYSMQLFICYMISVMFTKVWHKITEQEI